MKYLTLVLVAVNCFVLSWCQSMTTMKMMAAPSSPMPMAMPTNTSALDDVAKKCMVQERVDQQYAMDFDNGKIKPENVSAAYKCFIHCIVEGRGYMKDGKLLEENIVKAAENIKNVEQVRKIIGNCKIPQGHNVCEESFNTYMCISSELK